MPVLQFESDYNSAINRDCKYIIIIILCIKVDCQVIVAIHGQIKGVWTLLLREPPYHYSGPLSGSTKNVILSS